jgi:hypothetical protein
MHLTYPNQDVYLEAASTAEAEETGAPEADLDVTPEMIDAGVSAFYDLCPELEMPPMLTARDLVSRILAASLQDRTPALFARKY